MDSKYFTIEDHFMNDNDNNLEKLIENICRNESLNIHYKVPGNIGIDYVRDDVERYKFTNDIFIPYKFRGREVHGINTIKEGDICVKRRQMDINTIEKLNSSSIYRLFDYEEYLSFYTDIFKTILGIYNDIDMVCVKNHENKNNKFILPESFNNYVNFDNFMLFYRNDKELLKDSKIEKSELGGVVKINNKIFDGNYLNPNQSNRYNNEKMRNYLRTMISLKEIGNKGYDYKIARGYL